MLAGRVPFEADSTLSVLYMHIHSTPPAIKGISSDVQAVMNRALQKNPNARYQSSREMAIDFYRAIGMNSEAQTILQANVMTAEASAASIMPKPRKTRSWLGAGVFSLICLLALGVGAWGLSSFLPLSSRPTETANPTVTDSTESALVPITAELPEAEGMIEVAAGTYELGLAPADEYHSAPISVALNSFWVDKYQITNAQYEQFLTETGATPPSVWPGEADHPVRGVTWEEALAYCNWVKKRLPAEAEWEAAGRGPGAEPQLYPWGNDVTAEGQALRLPDQDTYAVGTQSFNQSPFWSL